MIVSNLAALKSLYRRLRAFAGRPILMHQHSVITIDDMKYCDNPIFVMGCHRSGTSLLRRILNSHSNIACPPESNFLIHYFNMLNDDAALSGLAGMLQKERIVPEVMRQAFRFHEAFRVANGKPRWADKTPQYVPYFQNIVRFAPPRTQFVVIFRNPYDIAYSIFNRGWVLEEIDKDPLVNAAMYVKKIVEMLIEIAAHPNTYSIHYEDLVDDAEGMTRKLCEFLDEPWDEAMLRPWDFEHNFGTEDPIVRSSRKFERSSENWKALGAEARGILALHLDALNEKLGYNNT